MALSVLNFESKYLNANTTVNIILPDRPRQVDPIEYHNPEKKYKVLWLLHGAFGDHSSWLRRTNIETYACEKEIMVVMPGVLNSNYSNWPNFGSGFDVEQFLIDELMPLVYHWFPASDKREDNFIAGLSMGGQGCTRYAVWYPEKFAAAAVLSGSPVSWNDLSEEWMSAGMFRNQIDACGGIDALRASHAYTWQRIKELAPTGELPRMYFTMGKDDYLFDGWYVPFKNFAQEVGLNATFEEYDGYGHEWRFWDFSIQRALEFFGLPDVILNNEYVNKEADSN